MNRHDQTWCRDLRDQSSCRVTAIPTQGSWGNGHMDHFCPLPMEMAKRVVLLSTDIGGVVFDPFAGTGTTVLAAEELGRRWLALDINRKYREMFYRRFAHERQSTKGSTPNGHVSLVQVSQIPRRFASGPAGEIPPGESIVKRCWRPGSSAKVSLTLFG